MRIIPKTALIFILMLFSTMGAFAEPLTYALKVDGLACPFCTFGIEKQLGKIDGVSKLTTDLDSGVVLMTMKDGILLDKTKAEQAVEQAGFTLRGLEQVKTPASNAIEK
ncbi:hypothetical protein MNBD_ALPHA02-1478 [hydrothermal vent metagenome]|uniref:HMA domain-containing protein n=1 Tax=hydrothermal vent metagenome TaxID=652676 RepID=A0A3B0SS32_9ZZZZ